MTLRRLPLLLLFGSLALPLCAQEEVGRVFASDAAVRGSVILASSGTGVLSGSQVTAGLSPARLQLARGGFLRICPKTSLSVASSSGGLLLGLSEGAVELHYTAGATTDVLVTPDFRIQLTGPGEFHFAISADKAGSTCIRPLGSDTASVIVSETFGTGSYQVSAGRAVVFRNGQLSRAAQPTGPCGCPEPQPPPTVELAGNRELRLPALAAAPLAIAGSPALSSASAERPQTGPPATAPTLPGEHLEAEAPLVYHGGQARSDLFFQLVKLRTRPDNGLLAQLQPTVVPPAKAGKVKATPGEGSKDDGLLHRIGRFFRRALGS